MKQMHRIALVALIAVVLATSVVVLFAGAAELNEAQKEAWEKSKTVIEQQSAVCMEHCSGEKNCLDKCESARMARLDRAFQAVIYESERMSVTPADIELHPTCSYCGMDRRKFAHSRVYIEYDDGSTLGTCSLHCAAIDMAVNIDKAPVSIYVGEYDAKALIDAEAGIWTIGGDKMGVMTTRAKWAFKKRVNAEKYIESHGGYIATFEEVLKAAYEDMYEDTKAIREKRKKMRRMKMKE